MQHTESALLRLPPELRNKIYEYCLVDRAPITVTPAFQQPPILAACRQIRHEGLAIFYSENTFDITVTDLDATLLCRFFDHTQAVLGPPRVYTVHLRGRKDWGNLLKWCEVAHRSWMQNQIGRSKRENIKDLDWLRRAVRAALRIATKKARLWEECLEELEQLRFLVEKFDSEWLR